jgi:DNA-directed RNA polymerase subunit RPC12/RpoP
MGIENGEGDDDQPIYAYPSMRSYRRRPRGNVCPVCGGKIVLSPRHHVHWFRYPTGLMVPIHNECGERLRGG